MKDFDHLISVWQGQPKQVKLSVDDVLKQVKNGVSKLKTKLLLGLAAIGSSFLILILAALFMPVRSSLTYIGIIVWVIAMLVSIVMQIGNYRLFSGLDVTNDPATYLSHLKVYKKRRAYMDGRFFYYYALAISIGVMLYTNEFIHMSSLTFRISFYAIWFLYIAFVVFYWKKKIIERHNKPVIQLIERLEGIKQQFE